MSARTPAYSSWTLTQLLTRRALALRGRHIGTDSAWQVNPQTRHFLSVWKQACEDFEVLARAKWGDQTVLGLVTTWYSLSLGHRLPYAVPNNITFHPSDCTAETARRAARGPQPTGFWERVKACNAKAARGTRSWRSNMQLKDPSELLARWGGGKQPPRFLRATDQYPECEDAQAARELDVQCGPLPDDAPYNRVWEV